MEGPLIVAVNVSPRVLDFSELDNLGAREALSS